MKADTKIFSTESARWDAVQQRDARAEGQYVYAVVTTGVYCRPGCPSRLALRKNIQFFNNNADAERAGFRSCKRCKPDEISLAAQHANRITLACREIEAAEVLPTLDVLANSAQMSRYHFHRLFKQITGITPRQYATEHRTKKIKPALQKKQTVTDAIYDVGFNSSGHFYASANLGMTPTQFRNGATGLAIHYAMTKCSLGMVLIAATEKGLCSVRFGENKKLLEQELHADFPHAFITQAGKDFDAMIKKVIDRIETPHKKSALPLDIAGTAFQQKVWRALQKIPAGETVSYSTLAKRIGQPTATRAVASACAANAIAVVIPCHRVVRADGKLSGYRWGAERKRALLTHESTNKK